MFASLRKVTQKNRIVLNQYFRTDLRRTIASLGQSALGDVGFVPFGTDPWQITPTSAAFQTSRFDTIDQHRHSR
jgi:hypothetical protein